MLEPNRKPTPPPAVEQEVARVPLWYHTIDLPHGVTTPGHFDLRPLVDALPWPDVRGKRCLDVGTYDGFYAFELEQRHASEVVATDISDHAEWDWPAPVRAEGPQRLAQLAGAKGHGFEVARAALDSKVVRRELSVYDLDPGTVGTFDFVVCGSLLLHLRDPARALDAIRSVCSGWFMSVETINLPLSALFPRTPMASLNPDDEACQWWIVNVAGHRRLLEAAGFEVVRQTRPHAVRYGPGHPRFGRRLNLRSRATGGFRRVLTGRDGIPHVVALARPSIPPGVKV